MVREASPYKSGIYLHIIKIALTPPIFFGQPQETFFKQTKVPGKKQFKM